MKKEKMDEEEKETIELAEFLAIAKRKMDKYDSEATQQQLENWEYWKEEVIKAIGETAADPQAVLESIDGENVILPEGLTAEESAACLAENFFLCVRDDVPIRGKEAILEFASNI